MDKSNRRKRKFIRPDMQLKVIFITFFVASFVLLINFQLDVSGLWSLSTKVGGSANVDLALEDMRIILIRKFMIAFGLTIPLSICVGILYSFKFSGPVHRFKVFFEELAAGRWDQRCELREGDHLLDVCECINAAVDGMRAQLLRDLRLLEDSMSWIERLQPMPDAQSADGLKSLKERLAAEIATHEERLGIAGEPESGAAGSQPEAGSRPAAAGGDAKVREKSALEKVI